MVACYNRENSGLKRSVESGFRKNRGVRPLKLQPNSKLEHKVEMNHINVHWKHFPRCGAKLDAIFALNAAGVGFWKMSEDIIGQSNRLKEVMHEATTLSSGISSQIKRFRQIRLPAFKLLPENLAILISDSQKFHDLLNKPYVILPRKDGEWYLVTPGLWICSSAGSTNKEKATTFSS